MNFSRLTRPFTVKLDVGLARSAPRLGFFDELEAISLRPALCMLGHPSTFLEKLEAASLCA